MVWKLAWDSKKAAKVNCLTNQRKLKPERKEKKKRVRCPISGCSANILSLRDHYWNVHTHMLKKKKQSQLQSFTVINKRTNPWLWRSSPYKWSTKWSSFWHSEQFQCGSFIRIPTADSRTLPENLDEMISEFKLLQ